MRLLAHWSTLVLFATVSVLGHGLHLLVDGDGRARQGCCPAQITTAHACCGHAHGDARSSGDDAGCARDGIQSRHDPHDCPICRFLAQGQVLARAVSLPEGHFARRHRPARAALRRAAPWADAYQARAPPAPV